MRKYIALLILVLLRMVTMGQNHTYYQYNTDDATLVFFDDGLALPPGRVAAAFDGLGGRRQRWCDTATAIADTDWDGTAEHVMTSTTGATSDGAGCSARR